MKSKLLESIQAFPSRDRMAACATGTSQGCKTAVSSQRPFCMLCIHCPKCADNPHQVTCPLCAACRACDLHGRPD